MNGAERIAAERQRQIEKEGWTPEHDAEHTDHSLAMAAVCYVAPRPIFERDDRADGINFFDPWPWHDTWDKRPRFEGGGYALKGAEDMTLEERIRQLEKGGALIAAEIDRLLQQGDVKPWYRDDEGLQTALLLVGIDASEATIAAWSDEQVQAAEEWAWAVHLRASDNDVDVPMRPDFLPEPWTGPERDTAGTIALAGAAPTPC